jgi:hypothetical protein
MINPQLRANLRRCATDFVTDNPLPSAPTQVRHSRLKLISFRDTQQDTLGKKPAGLVRIVIGELPGRPLFDLRCDGSLGLIHMLVASVFCTDDARIPAGDTPPTRSGLHRDECIAVAGLPIVL